MGDPYSRVGRPSGGGSLLPFPSSRMATSSAPGPSTALPGSSTEATKEDDEGGGRKKKKSAPSFACEEFAVHEMQLACGRILENAGFTHSMQSALDVLTDIGVRYMRTMATTLKETAECAGRSDVSLRDVELVYAAMGQDVDECREWMAQTRPIPLAREVPMFPAAIARPIVLASVPKPLPADRIPSPIHPGAPSISAEWLGLDDAERKEEPEELSARSLIADFDDILPTVDGLPDFSSFRIGGLQRSSRDPTESGVIPTFTTERKKVDKRKSTDGRRGPKYSRPSSRPTSSMDTSGIPSTSSAGPSAFPLFAPDARVKEEGPAELGDAGAPSWASVAARQSLLMRSSTPVIGQGRGNSRGGTPNLPSTSKGPLSLAIPSTPQSTTRTAPPSRPITPGAIPRPGTIAPTEYTHTHAEPLLAEELIARTEVREGGRKRKEPGVGTAAGEEIRRIRESAKIPQYAAPSTSTLPPPLEVSIPPPPPRAPPPPPITADTVGDEAPDNATPNRVIQLAILRSLFLKDKDVNEEIRNAVATNKARSAQYDVRKGSAAAISAAVSTGTLSPHRSTPSPTPSTAAKIRIGRPSAAAAMAPLTIKMEVQEEAEEPPAPLPAPTPPPPTTPLVRPIRLKILLAPPPGREGDWESAASSAATSHVSPAGPFSPDDVPSPAVDDDGEGKSKKHNKKKKKHKKEKRRSLEHTDDDTTRHSTPTCITPPGGGLKLKIRLGPRPSIE